MAEIRWSLLAQNDLNDIYDYISKDSEMYAIRMVEKIIVQVEMLKKMPQSGRMVPEFDDKKIRELISGNYRIIYQFSKSELIILRVHHSAKDLSV